MGITPSATATASILAPEVVSATPITTATTTAVSATPEIAQVEAEAELTLSEAMTAGIDAILADPAPTATAPTTAATAIVAEPELISAASITTVPATTDVSAATEVAQVQAEPELTLSEAMTAEIDAILAAPALTATDSIATPEVIAPVLPSVEPEPVAAPTIEALNTTTAAANVNAADFSAIDYIAKQNADYRKIQEEIRYSQVWDGEYIDQEGNPNVKLLEEENKKRKLEGLDEVDALGNLRKKPEPYSTNPLFNFDPDEALGGAGDGDNGGDNDSLFGDLDMEDPAWGFQFE